MNFSFFKLFALIFLISLAFEAFGQQVAGDVLATAKGMSLRANDLSNAGQQLKAQSSSLIAQNRKQLLDTMIFDALLELEAKSRATTSRKIEEEAIAKITQPAETQIKAVYDANRQSIGSRTIDEMRPQIAHFLRHEAEEKALAALADSLKAKHKFIGGKDVNAAGLKPSDVLATISGKPITAADFETKFKIQLHDFRAGLTEQILADLEDAILNSLIQSEAKAENFDASSLIAREITNKLRDYSESERIQLETALKKRLFAKYDVKFLMERPAPMVLAVSADDDPFIGSPTTKVTVVAFVDFQCSACAAVNPILKDIVSESGSNVRLVYRDYPLTETHDNALLAALAGNAAKNQGKFFEMADLMYRNQDALDAESLKRYAAELGMNIPQFERDIKSEATAAEVRKDIVDGDALAVAGTPTVFVNGVKVYRLSAEKLREAVANALK